MAAGAASSPKAAKDVCLLARARADRFGVFFPCFEETLNHGRAFLRVPCWGFGLTSWKCWRASARQSRRLSAISWWGIWKTTLEYHLVRMLGTEGG